MLTTAGKGTRCWPWKEHGVAYDADSPLNKASGTYEGITYDDALKTQSWSFGGATRTSTLTLPVEANTYNDYTFRCMEASVYITLGYISFMGLTVS